MKKKRSKVDERYKTFANESHIPPVIIQGVKVVYTPISSPHLEKLSQKDKDTFTSLLQEAQLLQKGVLEKVLEFKKKHESIPEVANLLTFLYLQKKDIPKAEALIEETFRKYPDYFIGKINYADQCLRKKKHSVLSELFPTHDLLELCPSKDHFHVSEYRGFMTLMSRYYLFLKNTEMAKKFYEYAYAADPAHMSVMSLEKKLSKQPLFLGMHSKIKKLVQKLAGIS